MRGDVSRSRIQPCQEFFYISILVIIAVCCGLFSAFYVGQDIGWDFRNYHYYNGYSWLHGRLATDLFPAGLQTCFNPLLDTLYYLGLTTLPHRVVYFLLGFFPTLNAVVLFYITRLFLHDRLASLLITCLGLSSVWFLSELGTVYEDNIVTLPVLLALFCLLSVWPEFSRSPSPSRSALLKILLAGVFAGVGCGAKLVMAPCIPALWLVLFCVPGSPAQKLSVSSIFACGVVFSLLVCCGPWLFQVWDLYGNPLFPQFNQFFHSPYTEMKEAVRDTRFLPRTTLQWFFYPIFFSRQPDLIHASTAEWNGLLLFLLAPVAAVRFGFSLLKSKRSLFEQDISTQRIFILSLFLFFGYLFWQRIFSVYRYLIPLEILFPLALVLLYKNVFNIKIYRAFFLVFFSTAAPLVSTDIFAHNGKTTQFHVDIAELSSADTGVVFLGGQPLAWLIPFLNRTSPFIQLQPNFPPSAEYWALGEAIIDKTKGKSYLLVDATEEAAAFNKLLARYHRRVELDRCKKYSPLAAGAAFPCQVCPVVKEALPSTDSTAESETVKGEKSEN